MLLRGFLQRRDVYMVPKRNFQDLAHSLLKSKLHYLRKTDACHINWKRGNGAQRRLGGEPANLRQILPLTCILKIFRSDTQGPGKL